MRLIRRAALSSLLWAGAAAVPLERAAAQIIAQATTDQPAPPAAAALPAATPRLPVTHRNVNLRSGPATRYAIVTRIPAGASVAVSDCTRGWCRATFGRQSGYIIESSLAARAPRVRRARLPGYAGPPPGYVAPRPGYDYPPPPPIYDDGYPPYDRPYGGWRHGYWRRW